MLADLGDEFAPKICAILAVEPEPAFVIWHVPKLESGGIYVARDDEGNITDRRIEIGEQGVRRQARFAVAHELVHWYATRAWDRLPHAIEEGLADTIGLELAPECLELRLSDYAATSVGMTAERRARALAITERTWAGASSELRDDAYAIGFEIVARVGIERLHTLCDRATTLKLDRVPLDWLGESNSTSEAATAMQNRPPWKILLPVTSSSP